VKAGAPAGAGRQTGRAHRAGRYPAWAAGQRLQTIPPVAAKWLAGLLVVAHAICHCRTHKSVIADRPGSGWRGLVAQGGGEERSPQGAPGIVQGYSYEIDDGSVACRFAVCSKAGRACGKHSEAICNADMLMRVAGNGQTSVLKRAHSRCQRRLLGAKQKYQFAEARIEEAFWRDLGSRRSIRHAGFIDRLSEIRECSPGVSIGGETICAEQDAAAAAARGAANRAALGLAWACLPVYPNDCRNLSPPGWLGNLSRCAQP
jgi:hypothetical protein